MSVNTEAQWFRGLGSCRCGKPATGELMGTRNQSLGAFCRPCATRKIASAAKLRAQYRAIADRAGVGPTERLQDR